MLGLLREKWEKDHGDRQRDQRRHASRHTLEPGQADRTETTAAAEARLGYSDAVAARGAHAGPGALQSRDRQQAAWLRRSEPQGRGRRTTWPCRRPRDRSAEQDGSAGQV